MKVKTNVKAGGLTMNHNQKQVADKKKTAKMKVKTNVKAGLLGVTGATGPTGP